MADGRREALEKPGTVEVQGPLSGILEMKDEPNFASECGQVSVDMFPMDHSRRSTSLVSISQGSFGRRSGKSTELQMTVPKVYKRKCVRSRSAKVSHKRVFTLIR